jgi:hypothetical protein
LSGESDALLGEHVSNGLICYFENTLIKETHQNMPNAITLANSANTARVWGGLA